MRIVLIWGTEQVGWLVTAAGSPQPLLSLVAKHFSSLTSFANLLFHFFCVFPKSGFTSGFAFPLNPSTTLGRQSSLSPVIGFCVLAYDQIRLLPTAQYKQGNSTDLPVFIYLLYLLLFQFIIIQNYLRALYVCFSTQSSCISSGHQSTSLTSLLN